MTCTMCCSEGITTGHREHPCIKLLPCTGFRLKTVTDWCRETGSSSFVSIWKSSETAARSRALHKMVKVSLPNTRWDKFFLYPIGSLSVPYRWVPLDHPSVNLLVQLYLTDLFQRRQFKMASSRSGSRRVKVKSFSHVRLFATPWTIAYQAPPSMGFSKQEYWSGLPFPSPGDLPNPGFKPRSPALQADALPCEASQGSPRV